MKRGQKSKISLLGLPLELLPQTEANVPVFLPILCDYLIEHRSKVGIFRRCGNFEVVQELGVVFHQREITIPPEMTPDDAASFLKEWLRKLPTPLIPQTVFNRYYERDNPESVLRMLQHLPVTNRRCLARILALLQFVIDCAAINMMTVDNVSTCFLPSLFQNFTDFREIMSFELLLNTCIEVMNGEGDDFILPELKEEPVLEQGSERIDAPPTVEGGCPLALSSSQPVFERTGRKRAFGVWKHHSQGRDVPILLSSGEQPEGSSGEKKRKRRHKSMDMTGSDGPDSRHRRRRKHHSKDTSTDEK